MSIEFNIIFKGSISEEELAEGLSYVKEIRQLNKEVDPYDLEYMKYSMNVGGSFFAPEVKLTKEQWIKKQMIKQIKEINNEGI